MYSAFGASFTRVARAAEVAYMFKFKEARSIGWKRFVDKEKGNNKDNEHIKKLKEKANGILGRLWSLAERRFRNSWSLRIRLFDVMVGGVIIYGAEQWGWKEEKEIERIQMKYIRWTLKLNRNTPWHAISVDTRRKSIRQEYTRRALKFDKKNGQGEKRFMGENLLE